MGHFRFIILITLNLKSLKKTNRKFRFSGKLEERKKLSIFEEIFPATKKFFPAIQIFWITPMDHKNEPNSKNFKKFQKKNLILEEEEEDKIPKQTAKNELEL